MNLKDLLSGGSGRGGGSLKLPGRDNMRIMSGIPGLRTACHTSQSWRPRHRDAAGELRLAVATGEEGTWGTHLGGFLKATCLPNRTGIILD